MSWIYGVIAKRGRLDASRFATIHDRAITTFQDEHSYFAGGGIPQTLFSQTDSPKNASAFNWIVAGVGLQIAGGRHRVMSAHDWNTQLQKEEFSPANLDGHFVAVRWKNNSFEIFTDELGLRDVHVAERGDVIVFSTRSDWVTRTCNFSEIDFARFGSRWLCINQLSAASVVAHSTRLAGGRARWDGASLAITHQPWTPQNNFTATREIAIAQLREMCAMPLRENLSTVLTLSGGFDSRALLGILLHEKNSLLRTVTFGPSKHPDAIIAAQLAQALHLPHRQIDEPITGGAASVAMLQALAPHSIASAPASVVMQLRYYQQLAGEKNIIIDGGFGEIWRRGFFNRLLIGGKRALINGNVETIARLLANPRADIFNDDVRRTMEAGAREDIANLLATMPSIKILGAENWLDLFAVRTRLINFYTSEQTIFDGIFRSYMPFAQRSLLETLLALPPRVKHNGKIFRTIIDAESRLLSRIPIVKGNITHSLRMPQTAARVYALAQKFIGRGYRETLAADFLFSLKEFIRDTVASADVRSSSFYDKHKLTTLVDTFFDSDNSRVHELDWWLAFEMWRQAIGKSS